MIVTKCKGVFVNENHNQSSVYCILAACDEVEVEVVVFFLSFKIGFLLFSKYSLISEAVLPLVSGTKMIMNKSPAKLMEP